MSKEIEEILEDLKGHSNNEYINPLELVDAECKLLLDYITNLQQENERLKEEYVLLQNASEEYEDKLQKRIDKANEYLEHFNSDEICENITGIANDLLNILQNGSDKE